MSQAESLPFSLSQQLAIRLFLAMLQALLLGLLGSQPLPLSSPLMVALNLCLILLLIFIPLLLITGLGAMTPKKLLSLLSLAALLIISGACYSAWREVASPLSWHNMATDRWPYNNTLNRLIGMDAILLFFLYIFFSAPRSRSTLNETFKVNKRDRFIRRRARLSLLIASIKSDSALAPLRSNAPTEQYFATSWNCFIQLCLSAAVSVLILQIIAGMTGHWLSSPLEQNNPSAILTCLSFSLPLAVITQLFNRYQKQITQWSFAMFKILGWLLPMILLLLCSQILIPSAVIWQLPKATTLIILCLMILTLFLNIAIVSAPDRAPAACLMNIFILLALVMIFTLCALGFWLEDHWINLYGILPWNVVNLFALFFFSLMGLGYLLMLFHPQRRNFYFDLTQRSTACLVIITLTLFQTPLLDPLRLSMSSQRLRLQDKNATLHPYDAYDFRRMRFHYGIWGINTLTALTQLQNTPNADKISAMAKLVLAHKTRDDASTHIHELKDILAQPTTAPLGQ